MKGLKGNVQKNFMALCVKIDTFGYAVLLLYDLTNTMYGTNQYDNINFLFDTI